MRIGFDAKRAFLNTSGLGNYSRTTLNALHQYSSGNQYFLYTPEIKMGMLENQDKFEIEGSSKKAIKIRLVGGKNNDTVIDNYYSITHR